MKTSVRVAARTLDWKSPLIREIFWKVYFSFSLAELLSTDELELCLLNGVDYSNVDEGK